MAGKLYLIPSPLAEGALAAIPAQVRRVLDGLDYILAENARTTRRFLSALQVSKPIDAYQLEEVDQSTSVERVLELMNPVLAGRDVGLLSEAGCPGVADPGSLVVAYAHELRLEVVPLVGPSSIVLALMASGLHGQQFAFHGYLPIDKKQRDQEIKHLERESLSRGQTQIFIEAPYRNEQLLRALQHACHPETRLCVARDLTGAQELVRTLPIKKWKDQNLALHKVPTIFLMNAR
ncbi:MAG: SAM-dependent methyltransferase [Cytophagales bacterium]|nr:SAM-dependent methyltransferase [Cytophagales bacterium]